MKLVFFAKIKFRKDLFFIFDFFIQIVDILSVHKLEPRKNKPKHLNKINICSFKEFYRYKHSLTFNITENGRDISKTV